VTLAVIDVVHRIDRGGSQRCVRSRLRRRDRSGMTGLAEVRKNLLRLDLSFAQGREIVVESFFFGEAELAGVGADETFIEDAAGKLIEALFFQGEKHARADLRRVGNGLDRKAALLAPLAKFFSEGSHSGSGGTQLAARF